MRVFTLKTRFFAAMFLQREETTRRRPESACRLVFLFRLLEEGKKDRTCEIEKISLFLRSPKRGELYAYNVQTRVRVDSLSPNRI